MGYLFLNKPRFLSARKIPFYSQSAWRWIWRVMHKPKTKRNFTLKVYSRASHIPLNLCRHRFRVHNGRKFTTPRIVNRWLVGYRIGEFAWNKKPARYKAKALRKKLAKIATKKQVEVDLFQAREERMRASFARRKRR